MCGQEITYLKLVINKLTSDTTSRKVKKAYQRISNKKSGINEKGSNKSVRTI